MHQRTAILPLLRDVRFQFAPAHIRAYPRQMSALIFLLAAVAPAAVEAGDRVVIDLTAPQPCAEPDEPTSSTEIVVCAQTGRNERYRLRSTTRTGGKPLPKAEVRLSENSTVAVETESADMGMARAQRAMVRFKIAF